MNVKINDKLISCADGVTVYDLSKIAINVATDGCTSGIHNPAKIVAYYKNGDGEWAQFGETYENANAIENI